ncbi:MAG: acyl-CoA dehydrogenase family protein, partial [Pseudonocardiaceae bacterium]
FSLVQLGVIGFPLGIARRMLEEFTLLAREKTRGIGARWSVAESSHVQADLGRAEGELMAARAFADQTVRALWDAVQTTGQAPVAVRAQVSMATQHAMRAAVSVTDTVFHHAGGGAIFTDSPLQRCFRDVHTAAQHVFYSAEGYQRLARLRLGFDEPTTMI